jgi:hypothetical protein
MHSHSTLAARILRALKCRCEPVLRCAIRFSSSRLTMILFSFMSCVLCTSVGTAADAHYPQQAMGVASMVKSQGTLSVQQALPQITQSADNNIRSVLRNNVRFDVLSSLNTSNDLGSADDDFVLPHMLLLLHRPDAQVAALEQVMIEQTDVKSPNYHNWLTAEQFGQFGLAASDLTTIANWLKSQGLVVNNIHTNGVMIDFTGTASQMKTAFQTEIRRFDVGGHAHYSNVSAPTMPSALSIAVIGIVSMNDFKPHTNYKVKSEYTFTAGSGTYYALVPADLATIYNLNPLFTAAPTPINGAGQTIALIEDEDPYNTVGGENADINTFRSTFGLPAFASVPGGPSYLEVHPACADPGDGNDGTDFEVETDVEWAGASAPGANLEMVSCPDGSSFGGLIAMQNLLTNGDPAKLWSVSYGECEAINGATENAAYSATYQQAAAAGISVFVSSGDEGAASCDADQAVATHGITVSGFTSTPYNVSVGGTDFGDYFNAKATASDGANGTPLSTYWSSTNSPNYGSALSYIDEIPWNDSCGSTLLSSYLGNGVTPTTFCNSAVASMDGLLTTASGSGGPSNCATGIPGSGTGNGGSCAGVPKPSWQSGVVGIQNDGVRDVPDLSLFAANGVWHHYWVICFSNTTEIQPGGTPVGSPCIGAPSDWAGGGGTSFSSPIMAGIQALVNQKAHSSQGNPNPIYYELAAAEYGNSGLLANCNSSLGTSVGKTCVFYDITQGDMDVNCTGNNDCFRPSGTNGVLSLSTLSSRPAYRTGAGWDFATGLGSVNAANLVANWPAIDTASQLVFTLEPTVQVNRGNQFAISVSAENASGTLISDDTDPVTVSLTNPGGATLTGTLTQNLSDGFALFDDLAVDMDGTYTLTATSSGIGTISTQFAVRLQAPSVFMIFSPQSVPDGGASLLTITLFNSSASDITGVALNDVYPGGISNTSDTSIEVGGTTCNATYVAAKGGNSVQIANGTIPANGSCTIEANVVANTLTVGTLTDHSGTITSNNAFDGQDYSTSLTVTVAPPTVMKTFLDSPITVGGTTQMTVSIVNPNNSAISGLGFSDSYPTGLFNSATNTVVRNTCGGTVSAAATSTTLTGGSLAAGSSCKVVVNVTATSASNGLVNQIAEVTTTDAPASASAQASLVVNSGSLMNAPIVTKTFSPVSIPDDGVTTSSMTITLLNPSSNASVINGVQFTDQFPAGMITAPGKELINGCGGTLTAPGNGNTVSLVNGTIPVNSFGCEIVVEVLGSAVGAWTNHTGATLSANAATAVDAQATLTVNAPLPLAPTVTKSFAFSPILVGGASQMTVAITNPNTQTITGINFFDLYPSNGATIGFENTGGASSLVSNDCGGTVKIAALSTALSSGLLSAGQSCSVVVNVTGVTVGTWTNATGEVTSANAPPSTSAQAVLEIDNGSLMNAPSVAKKFTPTKIPNDGVSTSEMTFTLIDPDPNPIPGVDFYDQYPVGIATSPGQAIDNSCGGTINAPDNGSFVSLTNGTIPIGATGCQITVKVVGISNGIWTNHTGVVVSSNAAASSDASGTLAVGNVFTVTPSRTGNGAISPSTAQTVISGATTAFTFAPDAGNQIASVTGTCGGTLVGSVYTTNAIVTNCTVIANFAPITFTVTPSETGSGTISPATPQTVNGGATISFTLTPSAGNQVSAVTGTCGGTLADSTYTTNAVAANCTVVANFTPNAASRLVFIQQPNDILRGQILAAVVVVEQDSSGNVVDDNVGVVTFSVLSCGKPIAIGSASMIGGTATFTDGQIFYSDASGLNVTAQLGDAGPSAISVPFDVDPNPGLIFSDGFEACRL